MSLSCIWDNPFMDVPRDVQAQIDRAINRGTAVTGTAAPAHKAPSPAAPPAPARKVHAANPGLGRSGGWRPT